MKAQHEFIVHHGYCISRFGRLLRSIAAYTTSMSFAPPDWACHDILGIGSVHNQPEQGVAFQAGLSVR